MKEYRILEPEVAGGLGKKCVLDYSSGSPEVVKLDYCFDGWLGDELLTTHPCIIVTVPLMNSLIEFNGSGYRFSDLIVSASDQFRELFPDIELPEFKWMKIDGVAGICDFGISPKSNDLVVSSAALDVLRKHNIENCTIRAKPYLKR